MSATKPLGTYGNAVGTVTPLDHKMAQAGLIAKSSTANLIRPGLFYNGNATIITGAANMSYNVAPYTAAHTRGATSGTTLMANDATLNVATTAAPGSNSRYDVTYEWPREYSLDGVDSNPVIGVVQGTAAASPTVPSLAAFPGAIELARILVPAGVTATNSGTTITQTAPFTATAGGVVAVRNTTERDAGSWNPGQEIYLLDSDTLQVRDVGGSWNQTWRKGAVPYAMAVGSVLAAGNTTGTTALAFAAGRFSVTPIVIASMAGYVANAHLLATASSTTVGSVTTYNIGTGTNISAVAFNWTAIQMTPVSAAG